MESEFADYAFQNKNGQVIIINSIATPKGLLKNGQDTSGIHVNRNSLLLTDKIKLLAYALLHNMAIIGTINTI